MMNDESAQQLIHVLTFIHQYNKNGTSPSASRIDATQDVANELSLRKQTIQDLYTRRLGRLKARDFDALVQSWLNGDNEPLKSTIKRHTDSTAYDFIDQFFRDHTNSTQSHSATAPTQDPASVLEEFHIQITQKEADMLRFIAKMRNVDPLQLFNQIASRCIRSEMRTLANAI